MSTFGDSQVRHLFVGNADQLATTPEGVVAGEIAAFDAQGGATVEGQPFTVYGFQNGKKRNSAIIDPKNVISYGSKPFDNYIRDYAIVVTGTPAAGDALEAVIYFHNYGASQGIDAGSVRGVHVYESGNSLDDMIDGLADTMNKALAKEGIPSFDGVYGITASRDGAGKLKVSVGRGAFVLGKFDGQPYDVRVHINTFDTGLKAVNQEVIRFPVNNGIEVANLEWFTEGNSGDIYRGSGYPNNFEATYNAVPTGYYNIYEVVYYSERIGAPGDKQRQVLTIANSDSLTAISAAIERAIG